MRDKLWLWGQSSGSHHLAFNLPGENSMTPGACADFFGLHNCCRVVMGGVPLPPFDEYSEELKDLRQVVWSIVGDCGSKRNDAADDLDEVLRQADMYPNISGGVMDDFFRPDGTGRCDVEELIRIRDRLHDFPKRELDLWMVMYEGQLEYDLSEYLDVCDVVTFWVWKGSNLKYLDDYLEKISAKTKGKKLLAGCYMWNYGEEIPFTVDEMKSQCEKYHQWLTNGDIDGIVFCSNCIADIGLEAVEWTRQWIKEVSMAYKALPPQQRSHKS